jgi:hypothetical protein
MRIYWYGEGQITRVRLTEVPSPERTMTLETTVKIAEGLGFAVLLDWSVGAEQGDGVAIFGTKTQDSMVLPGREDLEADSLVIWVRGGSISSIFFIKTFTDTAALLQIISSYMKTLWDISDLSRQEILLRARRADVAKPQWTAEDYDKQHPFADEGLNEATLPT